MIDHDKVKTEAKKIMDEFMNALDSVGELKEEYGAERATETRVPSKTSFLGFRKAMFRNAKKKNDDYIIMGKREW